MRSGAGDLLLIDAGSGARQLGVDLATEFGARNLNLHMMFTHFHWDHIQGLPFFAPLLGRTNAVTFYSTKPGEEVREILAGQMRQPYSPIGLEDWSARTEFVRMEHAPARHGSMTIRPFALNHPQGATGYRIEAAGSVIVHASDLEHGDPKFDSILRDHAEGADVLIYDAQYSPEEYESRRGWGHSTWLEAAKVARDARVKRLVLFHHDPRHNDSVIQDFASHAREIFENAESAKEGSVICA